MATTEAMTLIDVHAHALPDMRKPSALEVAHGWPDVRDTPGCRQVFRDGKLIRELQPIAWDPVARLADMDRIGVTRQVVSPAPFAFLYDADSALAAEFAAHLNEQVAEMCAVDADRLIGFGSVPLQDTQRAVAQLRYAVIDLGLAGIEIGSNAGIGRQLHDADMDAFFCAVEELDVPLLLHPGPLDFLPRSGHNGLAFALARPIETELAVGALVHGGVLERHPRLRICVTHAGAGVPAQAGRWHAGWQRRTPGVRPDSTDPRVLLARLWADTLTYDAQALPLVARTFGLHHLMLGTDYPFMAQESPPGAAVAEAAASGLAGMPLEWAQSLSANALSFLRGGNATAPGEPGTEHTHPRAAVGCQR